MVSTSKGKPVHRFGKNIPWLLLCLSGLSFLFFIGYPFENHNESYGWLVFFKKMGFVDILTTRIDPVQSFRPLGTATAWVTYKLTNDIHLQQIINWLFASFSFVVLFRFAPNKPAFAIAAFLGTSAFFAGYIYLFHLHGVFYGPLQVYIAALTCLAFKTRTLATKHLVLLFFVSVLVAFYHTFALLVFIAYLCGSVLQLKKAELAGNLPAIILLLLSSIYTIYVIISIYQSKPSGDTFHGAITSYTTTELNFSIRFLAGLFTILTVATTNFSSTFRHFYIIATACAIALALYLKVPVLLLWVAACIVKAIAVRKWTLAAVVASTALFPVPTHTGTPTYIVFVIMVCLFVMTMHHQGAWKLPALFAKSVYGLALFLLVAAVASKAGIKLPFLGKVVSPILAEQEKTRQMKKILQWKEGNLAHKGDYLRLADRNVNPSVSTEAIHRQNRPPTKQSFLDYYVYGHRPTITDTSGPLLQVTFGNKKPKEAVPVLKIDGRWNGAAYVY